MRARADPPRVAAIRRLLEEDFCAALDTARQVTIAGDVRNGVVITGDHAIVIQRLIASVRRLPTDSPRASGAFFYLGTPERPVPFGGRDDALRRLDAWLHDPTTSSLLLTAPAGRGTSALLTRWLARLRLDLPLLFVPVSIAAVGTAG
ncbi:MAG: hypothetical protein NZ699_04145 [Roseiflexus sp.]|nr:hypothetical protein [Roseiflexus sp.]MCS7288305.1 hypothetical protein [Roseiflexus sp.]MDW8148917.1 hypothetical protein [Roseiflexaceae bacterium]